MKTLIHSRHLRFALPALALGATMTVARPAHAGLLGLSEEEEIRAGQQVSAQAEKEYGGFMPANSPMSRRVRAIGAQFARLSTRKNIPFTYRVLNSEKVLNAFAAPGGPIFVTRKLVETTSNDAELAYVLGHETGHIERKHIVKQVEKQQKAGLAVGILGAILGRGRGGNAIGTIANVGWAVISSGYSRDDENEADSVGVRWMSRLGYDPRASISMLGKLGSGGGGGLDKYLASHPAPKARQASMQRLITAESLLEVARRAGGPRLAFNGTDSGYSADAYPSSTSNGDGNSYPPSADTTPDVYPSDNQTQAGYPASGSVGNGNELNLGAPLRVQAMNVAGQGNLGVVMAPVNGFSRWAGATIARDGLKRVLRRGNFELELRENSSVAYINRRAVTMTAPAITYDGKFYAPLGQLAEGLGARATMDERSRVVRLSLNGQQGGFLRLP